ncbi:MAG: hypothetical protein H7A21_09740 [Spirochaetales bacterium]|nr:hypothetical protein [Leptospiraceae bacterium]MCP5481704.1 hypothetical protein [Spirochaetales bacterium]
MSESAPGRLMVFSQRQLTLVQAAAHALVEQLYLTPEEAVEVIGRAVRDELAARQTTLEILEAGSLADRTAFVRVVVGRVTDHLKKRGQYSEDRVRRATGEFMDALHRSWAQGL